MCAAAVVLQEPQEAVTAIAAVVQWWPLEHNLTWTQIQV